MSILIKGMEMPESCYYCPFADGVWQKNKRCLINGKEMPRDGRDVQQNHISCPLIELPPHGRLIDADALDEAFSAIRFDGNNLRHWGDRPNWCLQGNEVESLIDDAPTIIEAEEKT